MKPNFNLYFLFFVVLVMIIASCKKDTPSNVTTVEEDFSITLYEPDDEYQIGKSINQVEIFDRNENIKLHFIGQFDEDGSPKNVKNLIIEDIDEQQDIVIMYDENKNPAFLYTVNRITSQKENGLIEFEMDGDSCFAMRIHEMNWETGNGTFLRSILVCDGENGFESNVVLAYSSSDNISGKIKRLETIRDLEVNTLNTSVIANDNYENLITEYNNPNLIKDGILWVNSLDSIGLDTIANPREFEVCKQILAGGAVLLALSVKSLLDSEYGKKLQDKSPTIKKINDLISDANFNIINTGFASGEINYLHFFANELSGVWDVNIKTFICEGNNYMLNNTDFITSTIHVGNNGQLTQTDPTKINYWYHGNFNTISKSGLPNIPNWYPNNSINRISATAPVKRADGSWLWKFTQYTTYTAEPTQCRNQALVQNQYTLIKD